MRENRRKQNDSINYSSRFGILGVVLAVILLVLAIGLINKQNTNERIAQIKEVDENKNNQLIISTSSEMGKNIEKAKLELETNKVVDNTTAANANMDVREIDDTHENVEHKNENMSKNTSKNEAEKQVNAEVEEENDIEDKNLEANSNVEFLKPIEGEIVKEFSMDSLIYSETLQEWVTHRGIDIKGEKDADVKATADGKIKAIKTDPRYGISVTIEHKNGIVSVYSCLLNADMIHENDEVKQGQVIGKVGNSGVFETATGIHLHFELLKNGEYINPEMLIK